MSRALLTILSVALAFTVSARQSAEQGAEPTPEATAEQAESESPIALIGNDYENGIKLLQNRFRIGILA